jgi:hypothetical protein
MTEGTSEMFPQWTASSMDGVEARLSPTLDVVKFAVLKIKKYIKKGLQDQKY